MGSLVPLNSWYKLVAGADWQNWADVKRDFPAASLVGDCAVFDIGGNKYRLVTRLRFRAHRVYVLKVMTHVDYDRLPWAKECGSHRAAPARSGKKRQAKDE